MVRTIHINGWICRATFPQHHTLFHLSAVPLLILIASSKKVKVAQSSPHCIPLLIPIPWNPFKPNIRRIYASSYKVDVRNHVNIYKLKRGCMSFPLFEEAWFLWPRRAPLIQYKGISCHTKKCRHVSTKYSKSIRRQRLPSLSKHQCRSQLHIQMHRLSNMLLLCQLLTYLSPCQPAQACGEGNDCKSGQISLVSGPISAWLDVT